MRIGIIGAGMAGLACAEHLSEDGHHVVPLDKGRGPGGRMSTRRIATSTGNAFFNYGAQYFTVRDAYVGVPAMNAPIRQMAEGQSVHWATLVTSIENSDDGWRLLLEQGAPVDVDVAIVATPAEQASVLLSPLAPGLAARASVPSAPCWTL